MTSCDENKSWLATRAARNLTLLPKQNLAKTTKTWPILTTMRIGAQKTKAQKTNRWSTEYVQGRQSQQNCTQSCKKVGLTLTKISSFQKRRQKKERKKHANMEDPNSQKSLKFHSDDLSKRCRGIENRKPTHPKPWKWWQHDNLSNCITNKLSQPWMCICPSYLALIKNES